MILSHNEAVEAVRRGKRVATAVGIVVGMDNANKNKRSYRDRDSSVIAMKIGTYGNEKALDYEADEMRSLLIGVIANDVAWLTTRNCQIPKIAGESSANDLRKALKQEFADGTIIEPAPVERPAALPAHDSVEFDEDDDDGL